MNRVEIRRAALHIGGLLGPFGGGVATQAAKRRAPGNLITQAQARSAGRTGPKCCGW
jgi:hypothetical protein